MRYSNRINLIVNIAEEINNFSILKITLQPIVENSILHGVLGKGTENGDITISAKILNEDLFIYVTDNGIGIPEEIIDKILSGDIDSKKGSGYGLKNIDQRIKLYYGENYGLTFRSEVRKGTEVEIKIPAIIIKPN
jgi:two-component system sensor histidine kinase YesM